MATLDFTTKPLALLVGVVRHTAGVELKELWMTDEEVNTNSSAS